MTPWTYAAGGEMTETLEWLTDLFRAKTGFEQRRRLRQSPRAVVAFDALEDGDSRRQLEDALHGVGAGVWQAPLLVDASELSAAWAIGDPAVLSVDTTGRRFRVGGAVLLIALDPRVFDVVSVSALTEATLTLSGAPTHSWPARTRVLPLGNARFLGVPPLARFTGSAAAMPVAFRLLDTAADVDADAGAASYRDLPVFEVAPDWSTDPESEPARALEVVDNDTGPIEVTDFAGIPLGRFSAGFTLIGRAEILAFRGLLHALAGRWGALWLPSWAADLRVVANLAAADTTIDVAWSGLSARALLPNRRDVRIALADGTVLYRRITAAAELDPGTERLTLDAAVGVDATVAEVALVSFLALTRQDADVNVLRFWSFEVLQTELVFRGFRDDGV